MTTFSTAAIPRAAQYYRLPELLHDIRLLDLLELSGTTVRASRHLSLSQPTVSRRYRALADDFGLRRDPRSIRSCRYGTSQAMRMLRLGCRAHRLDAGVARLGSDLLHHHLLQPLPWQLPVPLAFRHLESWAELVHQGVVDGALVSGLELEHSRLHDRSGLQLLELGALHLALAVPSGITSRQAMQEAVVPQREVAPGLHRALLGRGLKLRMVGAGCAAPEQWLQHLARGNCGLPLDPACCKRGAWADGFQPLLLCESLRSPVWLLVPKGEGGAALLELALEPLQQQLAEGRNTDGDVSRSAE